jgi:hypothetical protein
LIVRRALKHWHEEFYVKVASSQIVKPFQKAVLLRRAFAAWTRMASLRTASKNFDRDRILRYCFQQMLDGSKEQRVMVKLQSKVRLRYLS